MTGEKPVQRPRFDDLLAPVLVVLGPFVGFVYLHGRPLFAPEALITVAVIVASGLAAGTLLTRLRGTLWHVFGVAILVLIWIDLVFPADGRFRVIGLGVLVGVSVLRQHITTIVCLAVAAFTVSGFLTGQRDGVERWDADPATLRAVEGRMATPELPPVLHIVLDEHIGAAGLPDSPLGHEAKASIASTFASAGFRTYPRAYSRYSLTEHTLPNLLNFSSVAGNDDLVSPGPDPFPQTLARNAYFERMRRGGYEVSVYQPSFMDLCSATAAPVAHCTTVPANSLASVEHLGLGVMGRAGFSVRYWLSGESYLYAKARGVIGRLRAQIGMDPLLPQVRQASPAGALDLLERLEQDIAASESSQGQLYFAHILFPHSPFFFDRSCANKDRPLDSVVSSGPDVETAYLEQLMCADLKIAAFLERAVADLGPDVVVIVHGDHGSRLGVPDGPEGEFTRQAFADSYSTLFAIRGADIQPGEDTELVSIQELVDGLSGSGFDPNGVVPETPYVFLDVDWTGGPMARVEIPDDWLAVS